MTSVSAPSRNVLVDHYRCPEAFVQFEGARSRLTGDVLNDALAPLKAGPHPVIPPRHDPTMIPDYLRRERYAVRGAAQNGGKAGTRFARNAYYSVRAFLPVAVRRHLQRAYLRDWRKIRFPHWPVDFTVETVLDSLLRVCLKANRSASIPFIWFWPGDAPGCVVMTHDVETAKGRDFCGRLMDLDDAFRVRSSYQLIPEQRYRVPERLLDGIRGRGFEVNVHDLNHDGHLFDDREEFLRRARRINQHIRAFGARGFRSAVLYRNLDWYEAFEFSYDMSVPNVAHLDPQRGGCCTVMPYFLGSILEIPLTMTQDYSLFHILGSHSIALWKQQISLILEKHGLVSFNVHPDYIVGKRAREAYWELLEYLNELRGGTRVWMALPGELDEWWRQRSQMNLIQVEHRWEIDGPGKERARIAYARLDDDRVVYELEPTGRLHSDRYSRAPLTASPVARRGSH